MSRKGEEETRNTSETNQNLAITSIQPSIKKTARHDSKKHTIQHLPSDVLLRIFGHMNGTSLGRAELVCKQWRSEIQDKWNSVKLWRGMCTKRGLEVSHFRKSDQARVNKWTRKVSECEEDSAERQRAVSRLARTWRRMFILYRDFICRHCYKLDKRNLHSIFGKLRLCKECQMKMPYASVHSSEALWFFKFNPNEAQAVLGYAPVTHCPPGSNDYYKFVDVQKFAELKFGKEWADKQSILAREKLGIGEMKSTPFLKDI